MKAVVLHFLLLLSCSRIVGQSVIGGQVSTPASKPLAYVSVTLLKDSTVIAGTITNEAGNFRMAGPFVTGTAYTIRLTLLGYQPLSQSFIYPDSTLLAQLKMLNKNEFLGGVTVQSKRPLVSRRADRYIVNVEDSYLANGQSGLDVLQRSPGLWVGPDGTVRINGGQYVTVMINDVVQRMSSTELADFLRSLRSEDISKIEVIPNPPAEYEASSTGGIVHIILKKARKDGLTGTVNAQYKQQGHKPYAALGASLDYKLQRLYLFGGFNFTNDQSAYTGWSNVVYPDKSSLYNSTERNNDNTRSQFRVGGVYDFSRDHSLSFQAIGTGNTLRQNFRSRLDYDLPGGKVTGLANSYWRRKPSQRSYTLNYGWKTDTSGSVLRIIADYTTSVKTELNELNSAYSDAARDQSYRTNTPSTTHISSWQIDHAQMLRDQSAIKGGLKYVYTDRSNTILTERYENNDWSKDAAASNEFRYTEKLLMFYGSYEKTLGRTSIKAGLRGEQTWAEGNSITSNEVIERKYFGWFPSLFISRLLDEQKGTALNINYARRVRRPGYNDLNPYRLQVHDFTVLTGNPDLVPQYTHSLRAGYNFSNNYSANIYFQSTKNFIAQTANTVDSNIIEYKSKNFPNSTEYGISADASFTIGKIWNSRNSLLLYRLSNEIDDGRHKRYSYSLQSIQTVTWRKVMDVDMVLYYTSPYLVANQKQGNIFYTDIGLTRKIWKDQGRLRLYVSDIFNTFREKESSDFNDTRIDFYQKRPTRTVSISVSYTFRTGKMFTKKRIDPNNSDEKNRL